MSFWTMSLENVNEAATVRPCPDEDAELSFPLSRNAKLGRAFRKRDEKGRLAAAAADAGPSITAAVI
ncbi:hypothetical protein HPB52_019920 [Rhipicephalus sanguineus]|uniref:Uncharacterized protein n=1 Tax=Rhipicephalus sanguineus TaxID=34632 RepID=A0A9D4PC91_RHISA|nr:hypothetical protein HPB52_019920 [Rhipicephalus sanguineus]